MRGSKEQAAPVQTQINALLGSFKVPTLARELVPRLTAQGHSEVLPALLEVLELEAEDRQGRRIERLRRAAHLPAGKTLQTLEQGRLPRPCFNPVRRGVWPAHCRNAPGAGLRSRAPQTPPAASRERVKWRRARERGQF